MIFHPIRYIMIISLNMTWSCKCLWCMKKMFTERWTLTHFVFLFCAIPLSNRKIFSLCKNQVISCQNTLTQSSGDDIINGANLYESPLYDIPKKNSPNSPDPGTGFPATVLCFGLTTYLGRIFVPAFRTRRTKISYKIVSIMLTDSKYNYLPSETNN